MKAYNPLISITIPTYGGGNNLKRSLDSVLSQDYTNWECLVVDDNGIGTPNQLKTAKIIKQYEDDIRIHYICHSENRNGSAARNTGIRNSKGEFVCVLDDDDEYTPEFLSCQVAVFKTLSHKYPLTYVSKSNYVNGIKYDELHVSKNDEVNLVELFTEFPIGACCYMLRREVYDAVGGYDESFKRHQDWEFLQKILAQFKLAKGIDRICYKRYVTARNNPKNSYQAKQYRLHYLNKMKPYIDQLNEQDRKYIYDYHFTTLSFIYLENRDFVLFLKEFFVQKPGMIFYKTFYKRLRNIVTNRLKLERWKI